MVPPRIQDLPENDPQFQAGIFARGTVSSTAYSVRVPTKSAGAPPFGGQRNAVPAAVNGAHLFDPRPENPFDVRKALTRFGHLNGHGK